MYKNLLMNQNKSNDEIKTILKKGIDIKVIKVNLKDIYLAASVGNINNIKE